MATANVVGNRMFARNAGSNLWGYTHKHKQSQLKRSQYYSISLNTKFPQIPHKRTDIQNPSVIYYSIEFELRAFTLFQKPTSYSYY